MDVSFALYLCEMFKKIYIWGKYRKMCWGHVPPTNYIHDTNQTKAHSFRVVRSSVVESRALADI